MREKDKEVRTYKGLGLKTDLLYEEIIPEQTVLPGPFESILNKEEKDLEKKGDSTIRAEMTMPKSPIMGEAAQAKSPAQEKQNP